jgi:hypothetical protein
MTVDPAAVTETVARLLEASHELPPDQLGDLVEAEARRAGFDDAALYLVDHEQRHLVPIGGAKEALPIDGSIAGMAFQTEEPMGSTEENGRRVWLTLRDGVERLGVIGLLAPEFDGPLLRVCEHLSTMLAELVVSKVQFGDALVNARRSRTMTLAAELRWSVLPPLTVSSPRASLGAALEPAYEVAGDAFDYSVDSRRVQLAIFDAMGHGLEAARMANLAVSAYRHGRRQGHGLTALYCGIDDAIHGQFGPDRFVTGQLGELDCSTGAFTWVNAGHPGPMLVRGSRVIGEMMLGASVPMGLAMDPEPVVRSATLEPEDRLVFYTDGVVEARSPTGETFGEERLAGAVMSSYSENHAASEAARRLMNAVVQHRGVTLSDDATVMILIWRGRSG